VQSGEPVWQIAQQTSNNKYDLVVIGARWSAGGRLTGDQKKLRSDQSDSASGAGGHWRTQALKRLCLQQAEKIPSRQAVQFTGKLAAAVGASVTLLHVMAEPPAMYADLVRMGRKCWSAYCNQSRSLGPICAVKRDSTGSASLLKCICGTNRHRSGVLGSPRRRLRLDCDRTHRRRAGCFEH